jgi:prevent-host-death family protein
MPTVDIYEAKMQLDELINSAAAGEEVILAKSGIPLARLIPIVPVSTPIIRKPGSMKGRIWNADDFDAPLPDETGRCPAIHHLLKSFKQERE